MSTIPASAIVNVIPSVLSAGGNALNLIGLCLTPSTRVPIGTVQPFPTATAVSTYFGAVSKEAAEATTYFNSFVGSTAKPGSILFAQYNSKSVAAYMRGGNITASGLAAVQAMSGSLTILVDGYTHTNGSLSLAAATSFSSAATLIQSGLQGSQPTTASITAALAAASPAVSVTGAINGFILTITAVSTGTLVPGAIITGTGILAGTQITAQLTGTAGGIGTYALTSSASQIIASEAIAATYGVLTVSAVSSGTLSVGQTLVGAGITVGTQITALGTGTGLTGTYYVSPSQAVSSEAMTTTATPFTVTFDSILGSFVVTSGITDGPSSVAFATGTLAAPLLFTSATGAILSPGAAAATPNAFMNALTAVTQNWASFMLDFDPDFGSGNTQKLAFAQWTNGQDQAYIYMATDNDITATTTVPALNSLGYLVGTAANNYSGTVPIYDPTDENLAAFAMGYVASLDFGATNGRTTAAFRSGLGLIGSVTSQVVATNLIANGYNFYGAYATANQNFVFFNPGIVSGPFIWLDSFADQIWLNAGFQLALMELLTNIPAVPYNTAGYALIAASCQTQINAGLNFGAFRAGVPLSSLQITAVNNSAGANIAPVLTAQGWYFQVQAASPQVRAARQSPPCFFWYTDGQSVQQIVLNSIDVQ